MIQLQAEIKTLANSDSVPNDKKLEKRIKNLNKMAAFYEEKIKHSPDGEAMMFKTYVSTLLYAVTIISMYRHLTKKIAKLAGETDLENTDI